MPPPGLDVDAAEADEAGAARVNVQGTRNVAALGAPVVYYLSDYVFDGSKREPYVESDEPAPLGAYGRTKLLGEREVRRAGSSGARGSSAGPAQLRSDDAPPRRRAGRGAGRGRPARLPYLRRAPGDGNEELTGLPGGLWHLAAEGEDDLGRLRRGDLRGGGPGLPRRPHLHRGGEAGPTAGVLRAQERARGCPAASALARGTSRVPGSE